MKRDEIIAALKMLSDILSSRGIKADLFLVGGAALCVAYRAREQTRDVDAIFTHTGEVRKAALDVARMMDLPEHWLNDAVKGFLEQSDPSPLPIMDAEGLRVMAASPRYLLAMKLLASREEDESDIRFLCDYLGIRTAAEALQVVLDVYPESRLLPKTRFLVEEIFGATDSGVSDKT